MAVTPVREAIQVAWNTDDIPLNYGLFLTEVAEARGDTVAESLDMVVFSSTALSRAATYAIELEPPESVTLTLAEGWNLVSLPIQPADSTATAVFGELLVPPFGWPAGDEAQPEAYRPRQQLVAGEGLWVYWQGDARDELEVLGRPVRAWTDLVPGWNLVGPTAEVPLPDSPAVGGPVWWYDAGAGSYRAVETGESLLPGNGYWIFALEEAVLDLTE
jgi:hypothetical protein